MKSLYHSGFKRLITLVVASVCVLTSSVVYAQQEEELTPEEIEEAVQEMERSGFEAYGEQQWGEALFKWGQVLAYKPERTYLLYYSAQAFFSKGETADARRYALKARNATPALKPELAQKNEALLAELARIEEDQAKRRMAELAEKQRQETERRQIMDAVKPRASGWIWVGSGALALSAAGWGGAVWQSNKLVDVREKMKVPQTRPEYDALAEEADGHQFVGNVFLWSAVALGATGAGIIIWDLMTPEDADEPAGEVVPSAGVGITPNGAFVRFSW